MKKEFGSAMFLLAFTLRAVAQDFPQPYNTEPENAHPMPAEEAASTASLPPGFKLEVFAAEPEVQQPIAIDFDDAGRLWVAECYTFAERPLRWDLKLQDRILVLEDTDDDGKADKRTVFWDQGKRLTSIAVGRGGVYALCSPHLIFIPDADGDLVPDGKPQVLLEGFDAKKIGHNIANGLKWGPDGWLYGRHGITGTSKVGTPETPEQSRISLNCSIWRYHPVQKTFEVFCHGGTNPWGLDWDANGQMFYTNTVIGHLWHAIPGAFYQRMYGSHLNRGIYEVINHTADHYHWDTGTESWNDIKKGISLSTDDRGGGHAHMGCLIYQSGVWPAKYSGKLFTLNLHGRRINMENLERAGVGYVATHAPDFLKMKDPWFRGLDLIAGPKGHVWINDWSDTGECHDNDGIHRTSGRIYRIIYQGTDAGELTSDRPAWLSTAPGESVSDDEIEKLLQSSEEAKIAMGVRWYTEVNGPQSKTRLIAIGKASPTGLVRLELAAALQQLNGEDRFDLAALLCQNEADAADRQQPLMIWYGLTDVVSEYPESAITLALESKLPTVTRLITRRFAEQIESAPEPLNDILARSTKTNQSTILQGMAEGLFGWRKASAPQAWAGFVTAVEANPSERTSRLVSELAILFGDGRARDELLAIANDTGADAGARRAAI